MADGGDDKPERPDIGCYILDADKNPVREPDLHVWGTWMEQPGNRIVQQTALGSWWVSTVFLGLDHGHGMHATPILFETMIFRRDNRRLRRIQRYTPEQRQKFRDSLEKRRLGLPFLFSNRLRVGGSKDNQSYQRRYTTWGGSLMGHARALRRVNKVRSHVMSQRTLDDWEAC